jgi:hypothetical protein
MTHFGEQHSFHRFNVGAAPHHVAAYEAGGAVSAMLAATNTNFMRCLPGASRDQE